MPLVEITLRRGPSADRLKAICDAVHEALVAVANVPADDRFQIVHAVDPDRLIAHHGYGGVSRSEELVIVRITLNAGRTPEIKKSLYAEIARRLERAAAIRPDDVLICLVEVTKENWSFGGGRMTYG
jgi:phenylpyruvate tautomerase PptA (4-oxalocrotonate tautomerase family)